MTIKERTKKGGGFFICLLFLFSGACSARLPVKTDPDYDKTKTRLIALLPVENKTEDQTIGPMIRGKMLDELYFKGYPKIPPEVVDMNLSRKYGQNRGRAWDAASPQELGGLLGVDALMYCTVNESGTKTFLLYAPTTVSLSCELRSAKTAKNLWENVYSAVKRHFGYSRSDLKMKIAETYEAVIQEAVTEIIKTLPDGPDLTG